PAGRFRPPVVWAASRLTASLRCAAQGIRGRPRQKSLLGIVRGKLGGCKDVLSGAPAEDGVRVLEYQAQGCGQLEKRCRPSASGQRLQYPRLNALVERLMFGIDRDVPIRIALECVPAGGHRTRSVGAAIERAHGIDAALVRNQERTRQARFTPCLIAHAARLLVGSRDPPGEPFALFDRVGMLEESGNA